MKRKIINIVIACTLSVLVISMVFLGKMLRDYLAEYMMHKSLQAIHERELPEFSSINQGLLDLHEKNPDCICWLKVPGTRIDYPVMYRPQDKDYYLHRDFNGDYALAGTLYIDEDCNSINGDNTIIYGHHMQNGAMLADLEKFKEESFYKKHKHVELDTLTGHRGYTIIAAFATPVGAKNSFAYYSFTEAEDEKDFDDYIFECKRRSYYDIATTAIYGQKLLTISTCEYSHTNGRMVIVAAERLSEKERLIDEQDH